MIPKIIPVIHYADDEQTMRNAQRALEAGCDGIMLIDMQGSNAGRLAAAAMSIKTRRPDMLVGINYLSCDPVLAMERNIADGLDMTWTDEQLTHSSGDHIADAERARDVLSTCDGHLLFTGVAFKHQRIEPNPVEAARNAVAMGLIPTTSGSATGIAAEVDRIAALRSGLGAEAPLAIASGITPRNAAEFSPHLSHILVATGVSSSFHEFDPELLSALVAAVRA